jgi:glycolate oxidase FAD binding subunit
VTTHQPGSVTALSALLREAARGPAGAAHTPFRLHAADTWRAATTRLSNDARALDLSRFGGVHAYQPTDLTISVGSAMTLAELDAVTGEHGQWCPLQPWGDDSGSVGATVATATSGPFAAALGRPRDLVLGLECVDGRGRLIRAGGSVVKNVAGFDLTRLMTGAWGTLGAITALHLRLRSRPVVDGSFVLSGPPDVEARAAALARGAYAPLALVRVSAELRRALRFGPDARVLLRLGGNAAFVAASTAAFANIADLSAVPEHVWTTVRAEGAPEGSDARAAAWRWDALSARIKHQFDPADLLNRGLFGGVS